MNTTGAKKVKNENGQYITGEYNYRGFRLSNDNGTWKVYKLTEDGEPYGDVVLTASHKVCAIIEVDKLLTVKRYYIAYNYRKLDLTTTEGRQRLIDGFVNSIYLYDDHFIITFNYKNQSKTVSFDEVNSSSLTSTGSPN